MVDQRWLKAATPTPTATDRFQYGYDRDSNVLYKDNKVISSFSELYHTNGASGGYDALDRLTDFKRGSLSDSNSDGVPDTVSTAARAQGWSLDALGNWKQQTTDSSTATRTHDDRNELTGTGTDTLGFDDDGNTTSDTGASSATGTYAYDAWDRLASDTPASSSFSSTSGCGSGTYCDTSSSSSAYTYDYDALGRRQAEHAAESSCSTSDYDDGMSTFSSNYHACQTTDTDHGLYYSSDWQVLQDRQNVTCNYSYGCSYACCSTGCTTPTYSYTCSCSGCDAHGGTDQNVWGLGYVDDLVLRDRSADGVVAPDPSFGTGGKVTSGFSGYGVGYTLAVQPDGKSLLTGYGGGPAGYGWYLARYDADGSLDSTFGTGGLVVTSLGQSDAWTGAVAEADGKIVLGGYTLDGVSSSSGYDFALARYNTDGSLDTTFGTGGVVVTDFASGDDVIRGLAVLPDGSIVAAGDEVDGSGHRTFGLAKYHADGSLDSSFGTAGQLTTSFSGYADVLRLPGRAAGREAGRGRLLHRLGDGPV